MPKGKPTPDYKFRLLCKRCDSYLHTWIEQYVDGIELRCAECGQRADDLDEVKSKEASSKRSASR
jgi:hypothetical protein